MAERRRKKRRRKGRGFRLLVGGLVLLAVAALLALVLWPEGSSQEFARTVAKHGPLASSLFFTGNLNGRLIPCGCEEGELGGVARAATVFAHWAAERSDRIVVDIGNATVPSHPAAETVDRFTFEALDRLGCLVVNCGVNEVTRPPERLSELARGRAFQLISANFVRGDSGKPVFAPHHVVARGGLRLAFVGLVDDRFDWPDRPSHLRLLPPEEALARELPELRQQADAIIVLAFLPPERIYELAQKVEGVSLFVGGRTGVSSGEPETVNQAAIAYLGDEGCSVARLDFTTRSGQAPDVEFTTRLLDPTVEPEAAMTQIVARFEATLGNTARPGADWNPRMPCTGSYVGADVCALCHAKEYYKWYGSAHAGAYVSLLKGRKHTDAACLGCHTTGYGLPGGYDPEKPDLPPPTPKQLAELAKDNKQRPLSQNPLKSVGCESCHGGARRHLGQALLFLKTPIEVRKAPQLRPRPALQHCTVCHTPNRPCLPEGKDDPYTKDTPVKCKPCEGSGKINRDPCQPCKGTGKVQGGTAVCDSCKGAGKVGGDPCARCNATGQVTARTQYLGAIQHWGEGASAPLPKLPEPDASPKAP